jgi:hypothetical protein
MARRLHIRHLRAICLVMNRGGRQGLMLCDDDDRRLSISTVAEGCQKTTWQGRSFYMTLS